MPYNSTKDLDPKIKDVLPQRAQKIYVAAYNNSFEKYGEDKAHAIAWSAVKKKYKKDGKTGKWGEKEEIKSMSFYITKANIDNNGKMLFQATASDTLPDQYDERMSLELYQSFIDQSTGNEYISLSHYSELDGKGVLGKIENIYIDGNKLKIRGYFSNTRLGIGAFNAIRKDRRDNIPEEKRVRLSIGFYDRKHEHDGYTWEYKSAKPCLKCAMGFKKDKVYKEGLLVHCACTRIPVNARSTFDYVKEEK